MRISSVAQIAICLCAQAVASAAPRIDNVLIGMVPPGATSLVGAHMNELTASELYQKLMARQTFPQLGVFFRETGFDPRRDVSEILMVTVPQGSVLLARGTFNLKQDPAPNMKLVRHGQYNIRALDDYGYCLLDSSLAAAGEVPGIEAALDEWTRGAHKGAPELLHTVASIDEQTQLWGVSTGFARFLAANLPRAGNGIDFSAIFKGIESTWFTASVTSGLQASIHGTAANEKDAMSLRDTAKGLIGFGRLSVPEGRSDLLRFWDGITVEQSGKEFALNANIPGNLIDQMVQMLSAPGGRGARGGSGRGGRGVIDGRGQRVQ